MERLQTAIQKARAQRQDPQAGTGRRAASAPDAPVDIPSDIQAAWLDLKEMAYDPAVLQTNRIVAGSGGVEAQAFDMLRTKILRMNKQNDWKRIAVVSPSAASGKSTTVANLAFAFSRQSDIRAIVFDFDLRRPSLSHLLGQKIPHNMGDVLRGKVPFNDHALRIGSNMALAMNNGPVHQSAELLQSNQTEDLLTAVEETYGTDLLLFDMPPMLAVDDAHGFLRSVDAALIVMEAEKTPVKQIDVVERQVAELTNVAGIVLNKCNYSDNTYSSNYGNYY